MGVPILGRVKEIFFRAIKSPLFWAKLAGISIPLGVLLIILYFNYLPFGYSEDFVIDVGTEADTKTSELYLEPSRDLSEKKIDPDGNTFRDLSGLAKIIFKPKVNFEAGNATIKVTGKDVNLIPPQVDLEDQQAHWDHLWTFNTALPTDLTNHGVFLFDKRAYFDGKSSMELASSSNSFEDGAFSILAKWLPIDSGNDFQQIVGHYNWELIQNKKSVQFQVGRMNNATGTTYSIIYPVSDDFFNNPHTALAIYQPQEDGYIELYLDGQFVGRQKIGKDVIWKEYSANNLSIGRSKHNSGKSPHFQGAIYQVALSLTNIQLNQSNLIDVKLNNSNGIEIYLASGSATGTIDQIEVEARK